MWTLPSTTPSPSVSPAPTGEPTSSVQVDRAPAPQRADEPGAPERHPRQGAIRPPEVPDPLGREDFRSQPPVDDPAERDAIRKRHERAIAQKQHAIAVAFLEEEGVTGAQASQVLRAVMELSDELERIRAQIHGGAMTPAEGREAIREGRTATREAVVDALGVDAADRLGARMAQIGGGY